MEGLLVLWCMGIGSGILAVVLLVSLAYSAIVRQFNPAKAERERKLIKRVTLGAFVPLMILVAILVYLLFIYSPKVGASERGDVSLSAEDKALKYKYRGIGGSELFIDSIEEIHGVNMFHDWGGRFYVSATLSLYNRSRHGYAGDLAVPKSIRVEWRDRYVTILDPPEPVPENYVPDTFYGGKILGNYTVKIAERIPDELLNKVRTGQGGLRLKIRVHPDGVLIGWDRLRGDDGEDAGGDFREAKIFGGKAARKGWYIHPKTGERIETDF